MPVYESDPFDPPAPVVRAVVLGPTGLTRPGVRFLMDTGAEVSALPGSVAEDVAAPVRPSEVAVRFYDGSVRVCAVAEASVEFSGYRFPGDFL